MKNILFEGFKNYYKKLEEEANNEITLEKCLDCLTSNSIISYVDKPTRNAMYILPNGDMISCKEHRKVEKVLQQNNLSLFKDENLNEDDEFTTLEELGCIRLNLSDKDYSFIVFYKHPTSSQYNTLGEIFNYISKNGYNRIGLIFGTSYSNATYITIKDTYEEEFIKDIKRGIASFNLSDSFKRPTTKESVKSSNVLKEGLQSNVDSLGHKLSEEQYEYFKHSKVTDDKGNLLVVYHGTPNPGFKEFNANKGKSVFGDYKFGEYNVNYFTKERKIALGYTNNGYNDEGVYACYLDIRNPYIVNDETVDDWENHISRTWKNIKDRNITNKKEEWFNRFMDKWYDRWYSGDQYDQHFDEIKQDLRGLGLDIKRSDYVDERHPEIKFYDVIKPENNTMFSHPNDYAFGPTLSFEELFGDSVEYDEWKEVVLDETEEDGWWRTYTLDDIVRFVLYMNETEGTDYDGIILEDISDIGPEGELFSPNTTDYVTLEGGYQIKSIDNKYPTESNRIDEDIESSDIYLDEDRFEPFSVGGNDYPNEHKYGKDVSYYGIIVDDTNVGNIAVNWGLYDDVLIIEGIEIKPEYRKNGYGEKAINLLKELYPNKNSVDVDATPDAKGFYSKLGFEDLGYNEDNGLYFMSKNINESIKLNNVSRKSLSESKQDTINFRDWVSNNVIKDKVDDVVSWFEKNRNRLKSPQNDYYYWIKNNDIDGLFNAMSDVKDKDRLKDAEKEGARLIYNKDGWKVYEITNYWASAKYGKNTRWCISGSKRWSINGDGYGFWQNYYDEKGVRFFFFIKNNSEKYCIALYPNNNYEIWNQEDVPVAYIPDAPKIDEIPVDYTYDGNEMEKLLNLFVQNKLPNDLSIKIINCNFNDDFPNFFLTDDVDEFISFIRIQIIPDSWFENLIENGEDSDWDGDYPEEYIDNINKFTHIGMEQAESVDSYYDLLREGLKGYKYFMFPSVDSGSVDICTYNEFSDVLYDIWHIYYDNGDGFFEAMQMILSYGITEVKHYYGIDELEDIGFSKEFIDSIVSI